MGPADWAAHFDDSEIADRLALITRTLERGNASSRHLEIDDGEAALTAAAVVASPLPDGPALDANCGPQSLWFATEFDVTDVLRTLTVQALRRRTGPNSEWMEIWGNIDADPVAQAYELTSVLSD